MHSRRTGPNRKAHRWEWAHLMLLDTSQACWVASHAYISNIGVAQWGYWVPRFRQRPRWEGWILKYPTSVTGIYCKITMTTSSITIKGVLRHLIAGSEIAKFKICQMHYKANSPNINPTKFSVYTVVTAELFKALTCTYKKVHNWIVKLLLEFSKLFKSRKSNKKISICA